MADTVLPADEIRQKSQPQIEAALAAAEPRRLEALAATYALMVGLGVSFAFRLPIITFLPAQIVAVPMVGFGIWLLANGLWRVNVIGLLAPIVGKDWGQTEFVHGLANFDIERFFAQSSSNRRGRHSTTWRAGGRYRDLVYSLREDRLTRKRGSNDEQEVIDLLVADIAVPISFAGSVEITPRAGLAGGLDEIMRRVFRDALQTHNIDPAFDALFDTRATDDAPLFELITPTVRSTLLAMTRELPQAAFLAQFERGRFKLQFAISQLPLQRALLSRPMPELVDDAGRLWWELTVPHRLIDALMGIYDGPLR